MDIYLFKPYVVYQRLYNCSLYRIDDIPLEKRQKIFLGVVFVILFLVFEVFILKIFVVPREFTFFKIHFSFA
ncbi:unnamed protein product [Meloidogyne enterolobii]|uniref:Uncharacterized protein n=1 Tax=Meloidogyne enterolobii TaxID=390850 RepID=A0ACB0Y9A2_MELEN